MLRLPEQKAVMSVSPVSLLLSCQLNLSHRSSSLPVSLHALLLSPQSSHDVSN